MVVSKQWFGNWHFIVAFVLTIPMLSAAKPVAVYDKTFSYAKGRTKLHVVSKQYAFHSVLTIRSHGFAKEGYMKKDLDYALVDHGDIADLNGNGKPEIYLFTAQMGSGVYGSVIAYEVAEDGELIPIRYREFDDNSKLLQQYMGHDEFFIVGNRLIRRFPLYRENDGNCCPSGGHLLIYYKLVPRGSGWELKMDRAERRP